MEKKIKQIGRAKPKAASTPSNRRFGGVIAVQDLLAKMSGGGETSVRSLAKAAGLHANGIQNLRSGKTKDIKLTTLVKLAGAIGYKLELVKGKMRIPLMEKAASASMETKPTFVHSPKLALTKDGRPNTNLTQRKALFWDIAPKRIPQVLIENDDWVIVRVFEYGDIADIYDVIHLYGKGKCIEVLRKEKLKPVASVMAYVFLRVDRYGKYDS